MYDEETCFYYLRTRYYDPYIGRFLNADGLVSTGTGLSGFNMFMYCNGNPINCYDPFGRECICLYERVNPWHNCEDHINKEKKNDSFLTRFLTKNGFALYDNQRFGKEGPYHEKLIDVEIFGPTVDLKSGDVGLGQISSDFYSGSWEVGAWDIALLDVGHVEASMQIDDYNVEVGAFASVYSPSLTVNIGSFSIGLGAELGSIGAGIEGGKKGLKIAFGFLFGFTLELDW